MNSVEIAPHSSRSDITVGESQRGRHGDPTFGPQADNEHETLESVETLVTTTETVRAPVDIEGDDIDENAVRQRRHKLEERELEEIRRLREEFDRKDAAEFARIIQEERRKLESDREKILATAKGVGHRVSIRAQQPRPANNGYGNHLERYHCYTHRKFRKRAYFCAEPDRCVMRDQIMPKNGHPNSPQ